VCFQSNRIDTSIRSAPSRLVLQYFGQEPFF
jgi:hypothetical protein